ncbi:MAG TPA: PAS domain S-box protein [Candidatus Brocadiaceae bacterium]|nr:PAS domain S-box protein [Candidatus Brocadiaceae bacterium]
MVNELVTTTKKFLVISLGGKDTEYAALRDYFMQEGYEASFVYNERDLYGLLENKKCFDVILLDVEREVDKQIVAIQSLKRYYPHTAVVPLTKEGDIEITLEMRMLSQGFYERITKPIHCESLKGILRRVFQKIDTDRILKRLEQEREIAKNINRLVLSYQTYKDFCNAICLELGKIVDFDYFSIISRFESTGEYYLYLLDLEQNIHNFQISAELTTNLERYFYEAVSKFGKAVIKNELYKDRDCDEKRALDNDKITSYMVYPLFIDNALSGCINILSKSGAQYTEIHRNLIDQVSAQITVALMNTMLLDSLTTSQKKYRDMVENAPEIIFKMDSHGKFLHVNRLGLELLGYSAQEMSKMYLFNLIPGGNEAVVKEQYNMLIIAPKYNRLVTTLLTRHGKVLDVEIFCSVQYDTSHRNYIVSAFVRDVTERRDLERRVSEYHERLEILLRENTLRLSETKKKMHHQKKFLDALIQNTNVYVVTINSKGKIVFVNRAIEKKFGYELKEVFGKSVVDSFIPKDKIADLLDDIQMLLSGDSGEQIEMPFATRDHHVRDILWNVTYFKDEYETVSNINLFGYDVTEQKILREQLIQAEKMSSLGTMISGVAHELNNPLSIILNTGELMMMREKLSKSATNRLQHIIDASQRCAHIVENLLKSATKRKTVRKEQYICINEVLKDALALKLHELRVSNIKVEQSLSQNLPMTMVDRIQLMQVFINLINNAYDAMKNSSERGILTLRTSRKGGEIVIEFEDNGPGIQDQEKLFTPFYTTKDVGKGTGLGLAVSYGIIKEHGGTIIGNNTQKGAVFTVMLPIKEQTNKDINLPGIKREYNFKGLHLLLVEDEVGIAESCAELLTTKGCHVTSASSAKDAVTAIQKDPFDIVVMDLKMPGEMSGIQLYEWMMSYRPAMKGKIILMTGDVLSPESSVFIEMSKADFISKPFHFNDFLEKIDQMAKNNGILKS